jgi:hypothetical protein
LFRVRVYRWLKLTKYVSYAFPLKHFPLQRNLLWRCQYIGIYFNRPRYFSNTQFFTVESNCLPLQWCIRRVVSNFLAARHSLGPSCIYGRGSPRLHLILVWIWAWDFCMAAETVPRSTTCISRGQLKQS